METGAPRFTEPPTEWLKNPERIHPLDELDPNSPLFAEIRVQLHKETLERVKQRLGTEDISLELKFFPNDVLANEVFVRRTKEKNGDTYSVVGGIGLTESDIPGIDHTPNTIYAHPKNLERLVEAKPEERQKIFRDEIIAGAEYVVIIGHGWGGKGKNFERYAMEILNGKIEGVEALDKHGNKITLTKDDLSKTIVINLDVMGSNNSMDTDNAHLYTEDKIISQWWEAVDRIGFQVENIKTDSLLKHSKEWGDMQHQDLKDLHTALKVNRYLPKSEEHKLLNLLQYIQLAQSLENGTWWQESIAILMGHSMGGNKTLDSAVSDNLIDSPKVVEYRKKWREQAEKKVLDWSNGIKLMRYAYASQINNQSIKDFYIELVNLVKSQKKQNRFVSDSTLDNTPYCMNVSLTPAIVGDKNNTQRIKEGYSWLFGGLQKGQETVKQAIRSVKLHTEGSLVSKLLIKAPNALERLKQKKLRKIVIQIAELTPLVRNKLVNHIGKDALWGDEIVAGTADEVRTNGIAMSQDSLNLERMTPPFQSIESVSPEEWEKFYKNVAIYISGEDKTVGANIIRQLAKKWGLLDSRKAYQGGIVKESPASNHHFNQQGVNMLMPDLRGFISRNKMLRYQQIYDAFLIAKHG